MQKKPQSRADVPWSKRQEIPDIQIMDAANQYAQACKLLSQQPPGSGLVLPMMNNAAMAVELYLKSFSAELIYIEDEQMPKASWVYSQPAITGGKGGHGLVDLLNAMRGEYRCILTDVFNDSLGVVWRKDLRSVLEDLEGVFMETRYPFEHGSNITRYNLDHLEGLVDFFECFVSVLPTKSHFEW